MRQAASHWPLVRRAIAAVVLCALVAGLVVVWLHFRNLKPHPPLAYCAIATSTSVLANASGVTQESAEAFALAVARDEGSGEWQRPHRPLLDVGSLSRCRPTVADVRRIAGDLCLNRSALNFAIERRGFSDRDRTIYEVSLTVRVSGIAGPVSGYLILGTLRCSNCETRATGTAPHYIQSYAHSYDHCNGTYTLAFEGMYGVEDTQLWTLIVRLEHANFEHHLATARLCGRYLPGVVRFIPDTPGRVCGYLKDRMGNFTLVKDEPLTSAGSVRGVDHATIVAASVGELPVCRGTDKLDLNGRWLIRPSGERDPSLCRNKGVGENELKYWTMDDFVFCPYTCRLRYYGPDDVRDCFARKGIKHVYYAGDSRTRNVYFDLATRLMHDGKPPASYKCPLGPPCHPKGPTASYSALGVQFDVEYTWGFFDQREPQCIPPICRHSYELNHYQYFEVRARHKVLGGLNELRTRLTATPYDVFVFGEGIHLLQVFFMAEEFETSIRSVMNVAMSVPHPPRTIIYHTSPAFGDVGHAMRDVTRMEIYNRMAIRIVREMYPQVLILDLFSLTLGRVRDRLFDQLHFFPSEIFQDPSLHQLLIGSEVSLSFLNLLCNE